MEDPSTSPHTEHTHKSTPSSSTSTSSSRCTRCNLRPKKSGRNLVVCIDGTSNQFGQKNTNVVKLFAAVRLETRQPEQCAYYSSGIGTSPKSLRIIDRMERAVTDKFGMAIAWNMEEIVKDAYGWLAQTYQEGDQIYLFGFSRGAYQVRVLAGMIHEVGLIRTPTDKQIGTAYDCFESIRSGKPNTKQTAREFKNTFSWDRVGVHFIGVWDTVSSVGLIRGDVFLSTSSSASHACHFRHALALDERRVKFMPEYFHEVNQQTEDVKYRYIIPPDDRNRRASTGSDHSTHPSEDKRTTEIKEIWFAGSHSDVGGKNRPGKSHQAGNASLLWMRREAVASGLVLKPTDIIWVPDDLDFGISDSMNFGWAIVEYMPITQQVSFSGTGKDKRRLHRLQPRRIIPGQKIHASVLYANTYRPLATRGEGFDIPVVPSELDELDNRFWETGLFDDSAAEELVTHFSSLEEVAPIYLDRLLFMLRFEEGKQRLRHVPEFQTRFEKLVDDSQCDRLVRLVTIVAHYEISCIPKAHPKSSAQVNGSGRLQGLLNIANQCLENILRNPKPQEGPRVVSLLRPLTKYQDLREHILTAEVLEKLAHVFMEPGENFGPTTDGLNCLLKCEDLMTRRIFIEKLEERSPNSDASRLSLFLEANDPHLLIAALRMVLTLARIPEARSSAVWAEVKPRIRKLASQKNRLIGHLAVEILLELYDSADRRKLNVHDARVRANLASALFRLNIDRYESTGGQDCSADPGRRIFQDLFGMDATVLDPQQRELLGRLKATVKRGNIRERTAATMTLVNLWETPVIRTYLRDDGINLLDIFVSQLQRQDSALLAAYALATCLQKDNSNDTKEHIKNNNDLPRNIIYMLRWDYFDDAVGPIEGFQIFGDLMQNVDLREKVMSCNITELLGEKLKNGDPNETRTSLICLQIFRFFDEKGLWAEQLVDKSLKLLQNSDWETQKAGVMTLYALAQTKRGVEIIKEHVHEIVRILVPLCYLPIQPTPLHAIPRSPTTPSQTQQTTTTVGAPPPCMMGPACALRILAQNETLRNCARNTVEYVTLKDLHLSGKLVGKANTSPLYIWTPNRDDVVDMIDKMIKAVDGKLSEDGLMSIGDTVLPHIQHWDRLGTILRDETAKVASVLPLLGVSILAVLALVATAPISLSVQAYRSLRRLRSRYLDNRILHRSILSNPCTNLGTCQVESSPAGVGARQDDGGPSGVHVDSSQVVETARA